MSKLYEIKDWYMDKLTNRNWACDWVEYCDENECFLDKDGVKWRPTIPELLIEDVWGIYTEPKRVKKDKGSLLEELDKEIEAIDSALINLRFIREEIKEDKL